MGKETRIDNAEGREIARVALENTQNKISQLSEEDYLSFDMAFDFSSSSFIKTTTSSLNNEIISTISEKNENRANVSFKSNIDLVGLKAEQAELTNSEVYACASIESSYEKDYNDETINNISDKEQSIEEYYLKGLQEVQKTTDIENDEKEESIDYFTYSQEDANDFAKSFLSVLDLFSGKESSLPELPNIGNLPEIDFDSIISNYELYKNGELTSQEYLDIVSTALDLSENIPSYINDAMIYVLENIKEINFDSYLEFSKITERKNVTLCVNLNYTDLRDVLLQQYNEDIENCEILEVKQALQTLYGFLPENLTYSQSVSIDKDGYINGSNLDFAISGAIPEEISSSILLFKNKIEYDLSFNVGFSFDVSSEKIEVPTLPLQ
jgi:hypothetical protein